MPRTIAKAVNTGDTRDLDITTEQMDEAILHLNHPPRGYILLNKNLHKTTILTADKQQQETAIPATRMNALSRQIHMYPTLQYDMPPTWTTQEEEETSQQTQHRAHNAETKMMTEDQEIPRENIPIESSLLPGDCIAPSWDRHMTLGTMEHTDLIPANNVKMKDQSNSRTNAIPPDQMRQIYNMTPLFGKGQTWPPRSKDAESNNRSDQNTQKELLEGFRTKNWIAYYWEQVSTTAPLMQNVQQTTHPCFPTVTEIKDIEKFIRRIAMYCPDLTMTSELIAEMLFIKRSVKCHQTFPTQLATRQRTRSYIEFRWIAAVEKQIGNSILESKGYLMPYDDAGICIRIPIEATHLHIAKKVKIESADHAPKTVKLKSTIHERRCRTNIKPSGEHPMALTTAREGILWYGTDQELKQVQDTWTCPIPAIPWNIEEGTPQISVQPIVVPPGEHATEWLMRSALRANTLEAAVHLNWSHLEGNAAKFFASQERKQALKTRIEQKEIMDNISNLVTILNCERQVNHWDQTKPFIDDPTIKLKAPYETGRTTKGYAKAYQSRTDEERWKLTPIQRLPLPRNLHTRGGLLGLDCRTQPTAQSAEEDFFEWARPQGSHQPPAWGDSDGRHAITPETRQTKRAAISKESQDIALDSGSSASNVPPACSQPSSSSSQDDQNTMNELIYSTKAMPEMLYVKRRLLDLPDWALSKPNMELGFTTVAGIEIHAEELVALFRPRFVDRYGDQVHEDASYEWQAQSMFQSRRIGDRIFDFGSRDQDTHNIAMRRYVWSYGRGELEMDVEDQDEKAHKKDTTPHPQVLSAPKRMRYNHSSIFQARHQDTELDNGPKMLNEEAWTPFAAKTPAVVQNYKWQPNEYPAIPVQLQHDLD